jgi:hypothetical protein
VVKGRTARPPSTPHSAALYLLAGLATGVDSLDEGLVVFVAWLTCATSAVGVYSTITHLAAPGG